MLHDFAISLCSPIWATNLLAGQHIGNKDTQETAIGQQKREALTLLKSIKTRT